MGSVMGGVVLVMERVRSSHPVVVVEVSHRRGCLMGRGNYHCDVCMRRDQGLVYSSTKDRRTAVAAQRRRDAISLAHSVLTLLADFCT